MLYRLKTLATLFTIVVFGGAIFASNAFATNGHQDHQGACARSTESIPKGVGDLKYNGVLQYSANAVGIHGYNGSLTKQMEEKLVVGVAVHSAAMNNHGCDGAGGVFGAGTRVIEKGEHVVVRVPPKIGKDACKHPGPKCKPLTIVVSTAFPVSCWNINSGRLEVRIYVRKEKKVTVHHPHGRHTVFIKKVTKDSSGNVIATPTGTFRFRVNVPGQTPRTVKLDTNPQYVGNYTTGTHGHITEIKPVGKQDWETVSAVTQPMNVKHHKLVLVFVNKEKTPQTPETPGICNETNTTTTGSIHCGAAECSTTTIIVGSGNTVNNEVNCPKEEPKKPPQTCEETGTCPPPPTCEETGTCPPPEEEKYTEISCTGFEEVTGGASFLVDCDVNTNTGKPISLSAHSNDSNSRVSGINCYSNGGSQTCPSTGGTFEFRVSGINSSSSIKYSSITAVASAGGVESKPFTSDLYPVDPEEGGFKN